MISFRSASVGIVVAGFVLFAGHEPASGATPIAPPIAPPPVSVGRLGPGMTAAVAGASTPRLTSSTLSGQTLTWVGANGLPSAFYDLIANIGTPAQASPSVVTFGADGKELTRTTYGGAVVSEADFPALDTSSTSPAQLKILFSVAGAATQPSQGATNVVVPWSPRAWSGKSFALSVDGITGLDQVTSIEAIALKAPSPPPPAGTPATNNSPNVAFVVPASSSVLTALRTWYQDSVIAGHTTAKSKSATIVMRADDGTALFQLAFLTVAPYQIDAFKVGTTSYFRFRLYTSGARFTYLAGATQ